MKINFLESLNKLVLFIGNQQMLDDYKLADDVLVNYKILQEAEIINEYVDQNGSPITKSVVGNRVVKTTESHGVNLTRYLFAELADLGYVQTKSETLRQDFPARLTTSGWKKYQELMSKGGDQRIAFMALQFSGEPWESVLDDYIKPAVKETGYELVTVGEDKTTVTIDDKIRLNIRLSHFVIVDLSFGNKGAYWEAGYAEALGKPVIYIIDKLIWDDDVGRKKAVHFDAEHQSIYPWDENDIEPFLEKLKTVIRVNISDATMANVGV